MAELAHSNSLGSALVRLEMRQGQADPLWGSLVFSAITGGTQSEHWRGGGNGRSLISLDFLFTFETGIVASH